MSKRDRRYYRKNYYQHNHSNKEQTKKITYDSLIQAKTITEREPKSDFNKIMTVKYIAVTVVILAIIFGSLILFRQM